jgi:hypothetical protein
VTSGFRPGNGIGLSNFASYSNSNPTEPGFRCETLDRFPSRKPRLAVDAKPQVEGSTQGSGTADENSINRPCSHIRIQHCSRRRVRPKPDRQHYKIVTMPAMPSMPSVSLPSMPDLSMPDFSDAIGRLMTEFNTFTQEVGDALPILEQMGHEVTTFKVTWGLPPKARLRLRSNGSADIQKVNAIAAKATSGGVLISALITSAATAKRIQNTMKLGTACLDVDFAVPPKGQHEIC